MITSTCILKQAKNRYCGAFWRRKVYADSVAFTFYHLKQGAILIDGQNIEDVTQDSLRANIALVTQDTSLLHRSVAENIKYGRPDASDADMENAVNKAKAAEFIPQLVDLKGRSGYNAQVGERGVKLSGGQRQRIAIARVFLKMLLFLF